MSASKTQREETGTDDVRRVREAIARQHRGDLAGHVAETNCIVEALREALKLGPAVYSPVRRAKSDTTS